LKRNIVDAAINIFFGTESCKTSVHAYTNKVNHVSTEGIRRNVIWSDNFIQMLEETEWPSMGAQQLTIADE